MCKHENVTFVEVIEAYHQRIFDGKDYFKNNEYGGQIKVEVSCDICKITKTITYKSKDNQPKWISERIEIMKTKDEWFFG